ncbi:unnamed protein product [Ambrosiozyma monospora]|uniref:Unnamed protein product n=1 Tax=Ambrosiozyma monospora TaxID=43982 RepID=A0ACB5T3F4_AMBMO|nr:unnamed protein product [Ambrosiozyma monospora]
MSTTEYDNTTIILSNPPTKEVDFDYESKTSTFKVSKSKFSTANLKPTDIAIKTLYLSNDPTQRGWIQKNQNPATSYVKPVLENDPVSSLGLAEIIAVGSEITNYKVGDVINGFLSWTQYGIINEKQIFNKIDLSKKLPLYYYLTVFGMTSLTAWSGLTQVGQIKKGDVVIVSAASGATGSVVVQLAKKVYGASKVIGISSSLEKIKFVESLGADVCLNYKDSDFFEKLQKEVGSDGVSLYWDNVGGEILDHVLNVMATKGRIVACGAISGYNDGSKFAVKHWPVIITRRLRVEGFIVGDFSAKFGEAIETLAGALTSGKLKFQEGETCTIEDCTGDKFEKVPKVWGKLFSADKPNGKLVSLVSEYKA